MRTPFVLGLGAALVSGASLVAQGIVLPPGASPQAPQDPGYQALIATCKTPPPARGVGPGGPPAGARPGGAPPAPPAAGAPGRGAAPPPGPAEYTVTEIPGVIAAGQRWTLVWETSGNNADGIIPTNDGGILIAQNHNSAVVKLDKNHKLSTVYRDTHTGGALSQNTRGDLFIVERGLRQNVTQLAPRRRVVADRLPNGDPLDCAGGVINDLSADSKGGVYYTMGGLFYVSPAGVVTRYGENLNTNGVLLSADEKTLYVTNGRSIAVFDVQADGALIGQRTFVELPGPGADGMTIDSQGRLYVTAGTSTYVIAPEGKLLGTIPAPAGMITATFGGPDKKTLYAVASLRDATGLQSAQVYTIPMIAQGYKGRPK